MSKRETEKALRSAFAKITPDVKKSIMERAGKEQDIVVPMDMHNKKRMHSWAPYIVAAAAILLLCVNVILVRTAGSRSNRVAATIDIDVNPGIELTISTADRVLNAKAVNQDAIAIIAAMDLTGATSKVAINAIIGEMLRQGYLVDERTNSILISVNAKDENVGQQMQKGIEQEIDEILTACNVNATVITQSVETDPDLAAMAENLGISQGKALLIRQILTYTDLYTEQQLAEFTIAELNELYSSFVPEEEETQATISENSISENSVSENAVSENSVSANKTDEKTVSGNSVSENTVSGNSVSENKTVSENIIDKEDEEIDEDVVEEMEEEKSVSENTTEKKDKKYEETEENEQEEEEEEKEEER